MMNLKRLGALSLSVVLALSALSGCKSGNDEGQSSSSSQTDASSSSVTQVEPMDLTGSQTPIWRLPAWPETRWWPRREGRRSPPTACCTG